MLSDDLKISSSDGEIRPHYHNQPSFFLTPVSFGMRAAACLGVIGFYLVAKFVLMPYLPGKWFVDSEKMYSKMGSTGDSSFAVTARIFSLLPEWGHHALVLLIGIICILFTFEAIKTRRGLLMTPIILVPFLLLNCLVPSKETIVLLLTLSIFWAGRKVTSLKTFTGITFLLYGLYGGMVRKYFLLMIGSWAGFISLRFMPKPMIFFVGAVCFITLFFLPGEIFHTLQGSRDFNARLTEVYGITYIRTYFTNPFPPVSAPAFIGNYIYAFFILHLPFFSFFGPKEMLLFANIVIYAWVLHGGLKSPNRRIRMLAQLFISHLVVLWIFEPDLGSYYRHFSSALPLILLPLKEREHGTLELDKAPPPKKPLLEL